MLSESTAAKEARSVYLANWRRSLGAVKGYVVNAWASSFLDLGGEEERMRVRMWVYI